MMIIVDSARKHGIGDADIVYVYETSDVAFVPQDQEGIIMLLGFDTIGRGLEVAYLTTIEDVDVVIHAMKIRPEYKKILDDYKGA
ncbi:MAG: hypothetical protein LBR00_04810 [Clostridiales Family XIII bacterium]|jgi:hypothetical protein|nr:hypothetical protein [Clostridiales Family XIII bacterium]